MTAFGYSPVAIGMADMRRTEATTMGMNERPEKPCRRSKSDRPLSTVAGVSDVRHTQADELAYHD